MRNFLLVLLCLTILGSPILAQSGASRPRRVEGQPPVKDPPANTPPANNSGSTNNGTVVEEDDVIKINTTLVTIPVSVYDQAGRFIGGLQKQDFQIFEDGRKQQIEVFATTEQPFTVV